MKISVMIDVTTLEEASELTGISDKDKIISEALDALITRERAKHLIDLGGTVPNAEDIPRRKSPTPSPPAE